MKRSLASLAKVLALASKPAQASKPVQVPTPMRKNICLMFRDDSGAFERPMLVPELSSQALQRILRIESSLGLKPYDPEVRTESVALVALQELSQLYY